MVVLAPPAARADQSAGYYRHGQISMAAKNYDQALADFREALRLKPDDVVYELAVQRAQFAAANAHIQRGEQLKAAKQYPEAAAEMSRAAAIDPGNFIAAQELQAITDLMHPPAPPPGEPVGSAEVSSLEERLARAAGPTELGPVAATVIQDFSVNSDPKGAYLAAGRLAGLNVLFDSSSQGGYTNSGRVSLDLHNVNVLQILRILNAQTGSFYVPLTPNTILVANDNQQKHTEVDPTVLKVFYVKNVQQPTDLAELAQAIRGLVQPQPHLMPVASINALVMRDTPDKVAMVQKLLDDLDKAPPEVEVDVRILQVNRDLARDLGLLPPTSFSIGLAAPATTNTNNSNNNNGSNGTNTGGGTTNSPTLNELTHLNSTNFTVTIPNATLNALLSDSNTQTIQEPQLRAIQGQKATLQIGQRVPVATGSFQPGIGGVGINPLVNTQFQYQPVGVNIDMTPEIHGDSSVLLKDRIEISEVDSVNNIGGIQQPVFGNRVIDHTIELKNGESAVLGGMIQNQVVHNVSGIPGLNEVPLFKWLFSTTHDETTHSEILVVMTPHIIRSLDITAANQRGIDTGTEQNISLHELPPASPATPPADGGGASAAGAPGASAPP
ncbi:MAG: tetratricopeptide repeat protein, partial [Terriglobales bacterium]